MLYFKRFFLLFILSSCTTNMNEIMELTINDDKPFETIEGVELTYSDSTIIKVKLVSEKIERFSGEKNKIIFPKGLNVTFYSDGSAIQSTLSANYAIKHLKTNITEVKNNVILKNKKGEKLNTEHLIW